MRGMQPLIDMRRDGLRPAVVFVDVNAGPEALPEWAQWQEVDPGLCDIDIEPSESLLRIDWRPFVRLTVHVSGANPERVRKVAKLIQEAGAERVISSYVRVVGDGSKDFTAYLTEWVCDTAEQCGSIPEEED